MVRPPKKISSGGDSSQTLLTAEWWHNIKNFGKVFERPYILFKFAKRLFHKPSWPSVSNYQN